MAIVTPEEMQALTGQIIGVSEWLTIDQAMIYRFADATDDHQFIHVDPERAALTPFGGTIAHGFLLLSLIPMLSDKADLPQLKGARIGVNYGGNRCRFVTPVRSGKQVRAHIKLVEFAEKRAGQFQQTVEFTLEIEGEDKPAMIAEWISQVLV